MKIIYKYKSDNQLHVKFENQEVVIYDLSGLTQEQVIELIDSSVDIKETIERIIG